MSAHPLSRRGFIGLALAGVATGAAACSADPGPGPQAGPSGPASAGFPVTVQDVDRALTFARPPERVVSLYPSMTEVLIALGAGGRIVGQAGTSYSPILPRYQQAANAIPVLSDSEADTESLLRANPDLIVSDQEYHFDGKQLPLRNDLAARGVQVYVNQALYEPVKVRAGVRDSFTDITELGRIFDANKAAADIVTGFHRTLDDVAARLSRVAPIRALLVTLFDRAVYADAGGTYGDVLQRAGGQNLTAVSELPPGDYYGQIPVESLIAKNPDVIVYVFRDEAGRVDAERNLRQIFASTSAGRSGRFVPIVEASFGGGLRSGPAVDELARQLHPDAFRA